MCTAPSTQAHFQLALIDEYLLKMLNQKKIPVFVSSCILLIKRTARKAHPNRYEVLELIFQESGFETSDVRVDNQKMASNRNFESISANTSLRLLCLPLHLVLKPNQPKE